MNKPHIQVIVGTTRPNRVGRSIADWVMNQTAANSDMSFELIDLADINLPMFDEPRSPMQNNYEHDHTKAWSEIIKKADGYIYVTGEYNHSVPPSLSNAIAYLNHEWRHKPVAYVGYGGMGGTRAIEDLVSIASELYMVPVRERVHIIDVWAALDENGVPKPENVKGDIASVLTELSWWANATKAARENSPAE